MNVAHCLMEEMMIMTKNKMKAWIKSIKEDLKSRKEYKKYSEDEINEMVMDGLFEGFTQGELYRTDLAIAAEILGFEVDEEFMNDPRPDPIMLKKGEK